MYDKSNGQINLFYKNRGLPLARITHTQDFTNIGGSQPTTYVNEATAFEKADILIRKLEEIHKDLLKSGITRTFYVSVDPYVETE
jgi:hypothetical protein